MAATNIVRWAPVADIQYFFSEILMPQTRSCVHSDLFFWFLSLYRRVVTVVDSLLFLGFSIAFVTGIFTTLSTLFGFFETE